MLVGWLVVIEGTRWDEPVLGDDAVAQRVQRLFASVGHGNLCARRARLALLEFAAHCDDVI